MAKKRQQPRRFVFLVAPISWYPKQSLLNGCLVISNHFLVGGFKYIIVAPTWRRFPCLLTFSK